jgi:hypothetical protein
MKNLIKTLIYVFTLLTAASAFADLRQINIRAFDDSRTSNTWPHLSWDAYAQFCTPRTHEESDMLRKGTFANTMQNDSEILKRLVASDWKNKIQFSEFFSGSIFAEVELSELPALQSLLSDIAEVYDLTGITISLPWIPITQ